MLRTADGFSGADPQGMSLDSQAGDPQNEYQTPRDLAQPVDTDGQDPASPGGPAPYNAAEPTGKPVTSNPEWTSPDEQPKPTYSDMPYVGPGPSVDTTTLHNARRQPREEAMTVDLWTIASTDAEAEQAHERMVRAKVAVAGFWPFLSAALSEREFGHRLALVEDRVQELFPEPVFRDRVVASLHEDYRSAREAAANPQPGNPDYFADGPEAGPNTGSDGQFAQFPAGPDPHNPMNDEYPMEPGQWTVPPDKGWVDRPMQFGKAAAYEPYGNVDWQHDENGREAYGYDPHSGDEIAHIFPGHGSASHMVAYRPQGFDTPEDQEKYFSAKDLDEGKHFVERLHPSRKHASLRTALDYSGEGVQTGPAGSGNPDFFSQGQTGVAGDGFAPDASLPEPDERVDMYGQPPASSQPAAPKPYQNQVTGKHVVAEKDNHGACAHCNSPVYREGDTWKHLTGNPGHGVRLPDDHPWVANAQVSRVVAAKTAEYQYVKPNPDGSGYVVTQKDTGKILSHHDTEEDAIESFKAMMTHKHEGHRIARWVLADISSSDTGTGQDSSGSAPAQTDASAAPPAPPSMEGGAGSTASAPLTIPNAGVQTNPMATGQAAPQPQPVMPMTGSWRMADVRERPTAENPSGVADEYAEKTWNAAAEQRPMQGGEARNVNTPQRPGHPIPTVETQQQGPAAAEDDEEDED